MTVCVCVWIHLRVRVSISHVNTDRSDCHCCLLNVTRWQRANWHWLKSTARSKTQSLLGWAPSLWAPQLLGALTLTHTEESHTQADKYTFWLAVCLYTPHLCDPSEMSPKTDNPTVIQTVPSTVNNSIWALLNQCPSDVAREKSPVSPFSRWDHV